LPAPDAEIPRCVFEPAAFPRRLTFQLLVLVGLELGYAVVGNRFSVVTFGACLNR